MLYDSDEGFIFQNIKTYELFQLDVTSSVITLPPSYFDSLIPGIFSGFSFYASKF